MCGRIKANAEAARRFDPTKTTTLRKKYEADLLRRFRKLAKDAEAWIEENLSGDEGEIRLNFEFTRSQKKVEDFSLWLRKKQDEDVLETIPGQPMARAASSSWQNIYLQSSYQKGLAMAAGQIRKAGANVSDRWIDAGFFRPVHADRAGLIFSRAYSDLDGITKAMDEALTNILTEAIIDGVGVKQTAKKIRDGVKKISKTRARRLARTETIRAHAEASLNTYEEAGVLGVEVLGEFATAKDNKVCQKCKNLEDNNPYDLNKARGLIPVHPNCRCAWLPIVEDAKGIDLR